MGVRLYPILREGATINHIVNVSSKKYQKYLELQKLKESSPEEYHDMLSMDDELFILNKFDTFGWGTFIPLPEMLDEDGYVLSNGELRDFDRIKMLFLDNGIHFSHVFLFIDGVYWC
jgi:hypothetical protein